MRLLQNKLSAASVTLIRKQVGIRFGANSVIQEPEALLIYEHQMLDEGTIREALEQVCKCKFERFVMGQINDTIAKYYAGTGFVPLCIETVSNTIVLGTLFETRDKVCLPYGAYNVKVFIITLYDYITVYKKYYGEVEFLHPLTPKDLFEVIATDAIEKGASDLAISEKKFHINIYYNINKRIVQSKCTLGKEYMRPLVELLTTQGNAASGYESYMTKYFAVPLIENYRGRVVVNRTFYGHAIRARILDNRNQHVSLEKLNLKEHVIKFILDKMITLKPGLYLIAGPTMSGKNTTTLAILYAIFKQFSANIISVENPVEILTDFMEQIDTETEEQFIAAIQSAIRQNPDLLYLTEMTNKTGKDVVEAGNQGKAVISTLHSNGIAEVPSRICDLTKFPIEHIMQNIEVIIYQQLFSRKCKVCGDEDPTCQHCHEAGMIPAFELLSITPALRRELMGKNRSEVYNILTDRIKGRTKFEYAMHLVDEGSISQREYDRWLGGAEAEDDNYFFEEMIQ